MKRIDYKKGQQVNAISIAGEDFYTLESNGIKAQVFDKNEGYHIPIIEQGEGKGDFPKFMKDLLTELKGKPIIWETVINMKLQNVLINRYGFKIVRL